MGNWSRYILTVFVFVVNFNSVCGHKFRHRLLADGCLFTSVGYGRRVVVTHFLRVLIRVAIGDCTQLR